MSLVLDDIRYFNTVSQFLNMTRASEVLGVTQPTLSYAMKRLENELGGELFVRLKNGLQLTQLGESFLKQGQVVLYEWEQAQKLVESQALEVRGRLSLGLHPSVALYTLEHFLPGLHRDYPELEISLRHGLSREVTEQVVSWTLDFGIVVNPKPHPDLVIRELCKDKVTVFSKDRKLNTLIYDPNLNQAQVVRNKLARKVRFKEVTSENLEVVAKLVGLGVGAGILPARVAKNQGNLVEHQDAPYYKDRICLIYRKEKQKSLASKTLIQAVLQAPL